MQQNCCFVLVALGNHFLFGKATMTDNNPQTYKTKDQNRQTVLLTIRVCCHYRCLPLLANIGSGTKNTSKGGTHNNFYLKDVVNMASQCIQHPMVQLVSEGAVHAIASS